MSIVSSTFELEPVQADGLRFCVEKYTLSSGEIVTVEYKSRVTDDNAAILAARSPVLFNLLIDAELFKAVYVEPWNYVLVHATNAQLSAFVREIYRNGSKAELALAAKRILEWITNGRFTDTQVRTAFGLTAGQWTTLKTKMTTLVNNYNAVNNAVGE